MSTNTSTALDQPTMTGATPKPPPDKVMRIATMTKQLLDEVHTRPLDTASLKRLRTIDTHIIGELLTDLTPDLRQELQRLALPLTRHTELTDAELRLAHAQLVGWLQGLLQTALSDPHVLQANDAHTVQTATDTSTPSNIPNQPNQLDQPDFEPCSPTKRPAGDIAPNEDNPAIRSARHTLITAITRRITQQRLTAAQAAAVLHLTGPRVTQLLQANIDEFTLDELVNLLPALQLTIQIAPAPAQHDIGHSRHKECPND
jgi:predicted XRE-type DNA-binding protein